MTAHTRASVSSFFFLTTRRPPRSRLFPYTTLFRSARTSSRRTGSCNRAMPGSAGSNGTARASPQAGAEVGRDTSELQSHHDLVCRLLLEKKKKINNNYKPQTHNYSNHPSPTLNSYI